MPPKLIMIRHGHALHNISKANKQIPDPELDERGRKQCKKLQKHLRRNVPIADDVSLIITSPMRRSLQTAEAALGWLLDRGVEIVPNADWQENSKKPCNTGSDPSVLAVDFPSIDFASVHPTYPEKSGPFAYEPDCLRTRSKTALAWLRERPESVIAVVTHSGTLQLCTTETFSQAQARMYEFMEGKGELVLRETTLCEESVDDSDSYSAIEDGWEDEGSVDGMTESHRERLDRLSF